MKIFFFFLKQNSICYFDINEDWNLIVGSFSKVHNIRLSCLSDEDMDGAEFLNLLYELLATECSFSNIVQIRSTPPEKFNELNSAQKDIWLEWRQKHPECVVHTKKLTLEDLFGDED